VKKMSNSSTQAQLYMMKGMIAELPPEQQELVSKLTQQIKALAQSSDDYGTVALSIAMLEITVEAEKKSGAS
jgi:DNA-binding ferritin-like protein